MSKRSWAAAIGLAGLVIASNSTGALGSGPSSDARSASVPRACAVGAVPAVIGGVRQCVTTGTRCSTMLASAYARYGLVCRQGRLAYPSAGRIVARIPIPDTGTVAFGAYNGSVWVIDRQAGALDANGVPKGALYRIDPARNKIVARIPGVIGGSIAFGEDFGALRTNGEEAVWVTSSAVNGLFRVHTRTHEVIRIPVGPLADEWPASVVTTRSGSTPGPVFAVWVANHHGGEIVRIDPWSKKIVASVRWGDAGPGGPQRLATDGSRIWAIGSRNSSVLEIDPATNREVRRIDVAPAGTCGGIDLDADAVWITSGFDLPYACWRRPGWALTRIDRATGAVRRLAVGGERPFDVKVAFGSLWVLTDVPSTSLFRIDPKTLRILGRLRLPGRPDWTAAITASVGSLWVRVIGAKLDPKYGFLWSTNPKAGALLRIQPSR